MKTYTTAAEVLAALTIDTDVVTEVAPQTEKHYSLNLRYSVVRGGKEYFISIKEVDVYGQVVKSHVRMDVDTDLPKPEPKTTKKQLKIQEAEEKLAAAKAAKNRYEIFWWKNALEKLRGW